MYEYATMDSPLGDLVLVCRHHALIGLVFEGPTADAIKANFRSSSSVELQDAKIQLQEYFAGQRQFFHLPLAFDTSSFFQVRVYRDLASATYGYFRTYEEFAAAHDYPDASPEVAGACFRNPLPIIIPDHRLTMTHQVGPYCGGCERKRMLQSHERSVLGWLPQYYG